MAAIDDYKRELDSNRSDASRSAEDVVKETADWFTKRGRDLFVTAFEHETKLRVNTPLADGLLVEQGFPNNVGDYKSKVAWGNFYRVNAMMFLREIDSILVPTRDGKLIPGHSPIVFWNNLRATAINHVRVAIELRIRRGFGIMGRLDQNKAVSALMLSRILDALSPFKKHIRFAVPLEHITRIYNWSNLYMHAGLKLYTWSPMFALRYLSEFFAGGRTPSGGMSVYAGIVISEQTIKDVQQRRGG